MYQHVCVCTNVCVFEYICICICVNRGECVFVCVSVSVCVCVCAWACVWAYLCVYLCVRIYASASIPKYIISSVKMFMYVCMHTYEFTLNYPRKRRIVQPSWGLAFAYTKKNWLKYKASFLPVTYKKYWHIWSKFTIQHVSIIKLCMCFREWICIYIYLFIFMNIYIWTDAHTHMLKHTHVYNCDVIVMYVDTCIDNQFCGLFLCVDMHMYV